MSFYSKISLFALLAAGSGLGMETPPRLKAPATSAAAHTINQPMIKVFSETQQIDTIQRNYLEASATLKNMLENVDANQALVLPESMIEDYLAIKDLLAYEYRLNAETTDKKTVLNLLKSKTEEQLVAIANACQRFELNEVGECAIALLAERLNTLERKEECLRKGSFNLNWTQDVAHLVTQKIIESDNASKTITLIYWLAQATLNKNSKITFQDLNYINNDGAQFRFTHLFDLFPSPATANIGPFAMVKAPRRSIFENMFCLPFASLSQDEQQNIKIKLQQAYGNETYTNAYLPRLKYSVVEKYPEDYHLPISWLGFYYLHAQTLENHISKKLLPEELILMEYCFNRQKEQQKYNYVAYPGLEKLKNSICSELNSLLFPTWWQQRSLLSKAAIIASSAAATVLAAWYGYKYFNKK